MRLLLRCNGLNNSFAVYFHSFCPSFFCFPFILFLFPFFFLLAWNTLRAPGTFTNLEHFSFNSVRWGGSWYFRPSSRGGLANFTPIAGMGHLISEPKFKIPTPSPLLISDKSLIKCVFFFRNQFWILAHSHIDDLRVLLAECPAVGLA